VAIDEEVQVAAPVPQAVHLFELTTDVSVKNPNDKQAV
jgi:hypothetical protein